MVAAMDMFQVASLLGLHRPRAWWDAEDDARTVLAAEKARHGRGDSGGLPSGRDQIARDRPLIEARRAAAREGRPQPTWGTEPGQSALASAFGGLLGG